MITFLTYSDKLPRITCSGSVRVKSPNRHFPRKPLEYILYFITDGKMGLKEDDTEYQLQQGDILILDPSRFHDGIPTLSTVNYTYVHFLADIQERSIPEDELGSFVLQNSSDTDAPELLFFPKYCHVPEHYISEVKTLLTSIVTDMREKVPYYRTLSPLSLMKLFTLLSKFAFPESYPEGTALKILRFLDQSSPDSDSVLTTSGLEEHFHLNYDYMNRLFKKATGSTIMAYWQRHRIQECKILLRSGMYTVKQVAEMKGFPNEFYFSRIYKKIEGHPPSADTF